MKRKIFKTIKHESIRIIMVLAIFFFFFAGIILIWMANLKIPDFGSFDKRKISQSTKIYDRTGKILLYDIHQDIKRRVVPLENISTYIQKATIAIEDSDFYTHNGIKIESIIRAVWVNLTKGGAVQGGSTITQQVIKNTLLTQEKSVTRKITEWILALKLDKVLSKQQILSIYLNESPYGGTVYGVEEATQRFFNKKASDVTLAEAAYIAAIPQAPTLYSPYGQNKTKLDERKNTVLNRMYELKLISKDELDSAKKEVVVFNKNKDDSGIKAPHFVEFVRSYLESRYGREEVETGGLNIITTLDYDLQQKAEETIKEFGDKNEKDFKAKNAGLIATDPKTGQILVMVGSRDYFNTKNEGNFNVTLAHRQPGSSFKPFVYATAFKKGYTPDTVLFDLETEFQANCDPDGNPIPPNNNPNVCYMPQNYDDSFRGPMSLRNALAQSINIPAIKLLYLVGINDAIRTARDLGITGLTNATQYGLTLVLGGGEVTLLDMTNAYSVFANDGIRNPYTPILKITDSTGKTLEEYSNNGIKVLETNVAREISDVLSDYHAKLPAYGENSPLRFDDRQVASKTGTTNDTKDAWVIGFTPNFAMGVWVGNNDNSPMVKKVAGMITAPLWRNFFDKVLKTLPVENFKKPDPIPEDIKPVLRGEWRGGVEYTIDKASGNLATPYTPEELKEKKVLTDVHSILYWVDKKDPLGPAPTDPWSDPQFNNWETSIKKWAEIQGLQSSGTTTAPTGLDNVHGPSLAPKLNILLPDRNRTYGLIETVNINLQVTQTTYPVVQADFFINNTFIGSSKNPPFNFNFLPKEIPQIDYNNEIKVIIYDSIRNSEEMTIPFKVAI